MRRHCRQRSLIIALLLCVASCQKEQKPEGIAYPLSWNRIPQWSEDNLSAGWPALLQSCVALPQRNTAWVPICEAAAKIPARDNHAIATFYQSWFTPHEVLNDQGTDTGLITGYYSPLLKGSLKPGGSFQYPIYSKPKDLLTIDLGSVYPDLADRTLRGRLLGNRVIPYPSRAEIDGINQPLKGQEIVWVEDPVALFFLHIQGSGRIALPDGRHLSVGFAGQNGHPYVAIGKVIAQMGAMALKNINLPSIRQWLQDNPEQLQSVLNANPSYVFFENRGYDAGPPLGTLNTPLTGGHSIAVDRRFIPLGVPVWLQTTWPDSGAPLNRLMFAQDTGGAIRGAVRADVYWGEGNRAETLAGNMKQSGRLIVLLPKTTAGPGLDPVL